MKDYGTLNVWLSIIYLMIYPRAYGDQEVECHGLDENVPVLV